MTLTGLVPNNIAEILVSCMDFLLIALLFYGILTFIRGTRAICTLTGVVILFIGITILTKNLHLTVLNTLLSNMWTTLATLLVVIFQPELRRALTQLGSWFTSRSFSTHQPTVIEVVKAVENMSATRTGALIVFEKKIGLASIKKSAIALEAKVSAPILRSIFYPNSPLHDGAVIISGDTIEAAHAVLPMVQRPEYADVILGTRHRAAIGVTEETDAVAVVVSEETGGISIACRGSLDRVLTSTQLLQRLSAALLEKGKADKEKSE